MSWPVLGFEGILLITSGPPFKTPAAGDKERDKRWWNKQAVFRVWNSKVALGSEDDVVISAEINNRSAGRRTSAEIANFKRFKTKWICGIKDAVSVDTSLPDKVTGTA